MPGVTAGGLEARAPLAEIDLARERGADHPVQRPVHGGPSDTGRVALNGFEELLGAHMSLLAQENLQNQIALV